MRVVPVGAHAVLIETDDVARWHAEAVRRRDAGDLEAVDIVPAATTVLLDGVGDVADVAASIAGWDPAAPDPASGPLVTIPVRFDGPDLPDVAAAWGVAVAEVPAIVCGARLRVAFTGFAPGFGYLTGLGRSTPRRATPRTSVPAGAVGLAAEYAGVYPRSSPGGWQIVGTAVGVTLWDADREPPALLVPGARVRFEEAP